MRRLSLIIIGLIVVVAILSFSWNRLRAPSEYDLKETKTTAETLLGSNKEAAYSIFKAYDRGYSPFQIVQSIYSERINELGEIKDEKPKRAKQNNLPLNKSDFLDLFSYISDDGSGWLTWMLGATADGYRVDQITEYMQRRINSGDDPEDMFGVPIIKDEAGEIIVPELPFDWSFEGRNILARLIREDKLRDHKMMEVSVIGFINAGYSHAQIEEALKTDSIGMGSTKNSGNDPSQLTPYYFVDGEVAKPENETNKQSKGIPSSDESPDRARETEETGPGHLRLIPTIIQTQLTAERSIDQHDVTLNLKSHEHKNNSSSGVTYYEVHAIVKMEVTQISDVDSFGENVSVGDRWVIEGKISPAKGGKHTNHDNYLMIGGDKSGELNMKNASGIFIETLYRNNGKSVSNRTFSGSISGKINEDLSVLDNGKMLGAYGLEMRN